MKKNEIIRQVKNGLSSDAIADFGRLQVIHNGKCTIDLIELSAIRAAREKSAKMGGRNDSRNAK